ncbi:MAG TPA: helix-turn-helix domain-containing protein [Sandaracinaceae bacterium LLY-WYZ-13_1]|nr:helix-turn-helix domain-containing protein [Sandaracinaceae bacterium LLY-WYZ-13_1]
MKDAPQLLTSTEAAEFLGASPTSIKRWADEGILPCVRTAGRHRRFSVEDLERFRRERMGAPEPESPAEGVEAWIEDLVEGRPYRVQARLFEARSELGSWRAVCDRVGEIVTVLGDKWSRGELSVAQEHVASERLIRALARVGESLPLPPDAPKALLLTLEQEEHTLGLALAELALRELGWQPVFAGRGTPLDGLGELVDTQRIRLVAVSAAVSSNDPELMRRRADELGDVCRKRGIVLVFGGRGAWPEPPPYGTRLHGFQRLRDVVPAPDAVRP